MNSPSHHINKCFDSSKQPNVLKKMKNNFLYTISALSTNFRCFRFEFTFQNSDDIQFTLSYITRNEFLFPVQFVFMCNKMPFSIPLQLDFVSFCHTEQCYACELLRFISYLKTKKNFRQSEAIYFYFYD